MLKDYKIKPKSFIINQSINSKKSLKENKMENGVNILRTNGSFKILKLK